MGSPLLTMKAALVVASSMLLLTATATEVPADICSNAELNTTDSLFMAASYMPACQNLSTWSGDIAETLWTCSDRDCAYYMTLVADALPDCNYTGEVVVNKKQQLLESLETCGICSKEQEDDMMKMYEAAAAEDSSCAWPATIIEEYTDKVNIYWVCGDSCQDFIDDLYTKVYNCTTMSGVNKQAELRGFIDTCNNGSGVHGSMYTVFNATMVEPTDKNDIMSSPWWPTGSNSGSAWTDSSSTTQDESCSYDVVLAMIHDVYNVSSTAACTSWSNVSSELIYISAPCASGCGELLGDLVEDLPDCYYDVGFKNMKEDLSAAYDRCTDARDRRFLSAEVDEVFVTLSLALGSSINLDDIASDAGDLSTASVSVVSAAAAFSLLLALG